ncbi:adenylyltransferase/cytidyltransferase family protein [Brumimicrobium mesophilum]|uniref:adenylyltransferase/cytidyltransferase family protein n=1 Tax=Brumimicrobium mesophilum TaxID=392717 RepID=UPI000D13F833|nr:adenylyltransferase/cytidyltransferase family protein [Brumimicrobium mesophilum]
MTSWEQIKHKLVSQEEASAIISSWKDNQKKVVFTNGCFDILHLGHVTYLAKAASLGTYLVVGVNADESVKRLNKAPGRPVNEQLSRALIIASLQVVDLVVIFDNDTPKELIEVIQPSILVKGADYDASVTDEKDAKYIVGSKEIKALGGTVKTIELEEGFSTTGLIEKLK